MAATVKGTAYIVGIGSTALSNLIPVEYTEETVEVSEMVRDGDGAAKARVIKDTATRYTLRGNYTSAPTAAAGTAVAITTAAGSSVTVYPESTRLSRTENPAVFELTGIKEAGITYS